jgi:hypothetical protein
MSAIMTKTDLDPSFHFPFGLRGVYRPGSDQPLHVLHCRTGFRAGYLSKAYYGRLSEGDRGRVPSRPAARTRLSSQPAQALPYYERIEQTEKQLMAATSEPDRERLKVQLRESEWWAIHIDNHARARILSGGLAAETRPKPSRENPARLDALLSWSFSWLRGVHRPGSDQPSTYCTAETGFRAGTCPRRYYGVCPKGNRGRRSSPACSAGAAIVPPAQALPYYERMAQTRRSS